jgi:hypothetical protein
MWWPCLLTDRDELSNHHRGYSIDASYQVSVVALETVRALPNLLAYSTQEFSKQIEKKFIQKFSFWVLVPLTPSIS